MKVIMFYIGNKKLKISKEKWFNQNNIKIEIGPTSDEHNYLMSNYPFYKKSYIEQKYAFCSDVWRIYKLNKEKKCIYVDFFSIITKSFKKWLGDIDKKNYFFTEIDNSIICNGIIVKNSELNVFKDVLKFYKRKKIFVSGPQILTKFLIKNKIINLNMISNNQDIAILSTRIFDSRVKNAPIYINSQGSWSEINNPMEIWKLKWDKKIPEKKWLYKILVYKITWAYELLLLLWLFSKKIYVSLCKAHI